MYDRYVRDTFGRKKIADIKYSEVLQFYLYLLNEEDLALSTLDNINTPCCIRHFSWQFGMMSIRKNPSDGVMKEIARETDKARGIRRALTIEQQRAFMEYIANHPVYYHWWPVFTILFGTDAGLARRWDYAGKTSTLKIESLASTIAWYITR